jgi:hypothetical protein
LVLFLFHLLLLRHLLLLLLALLILPLLSLLPLLLLSLLRFLRSQTTLGRLVFRLNARRRLRLPSLFQMRKALPIQLFPLS